MTRKEKIKVLRRRAEYLENKVPQSDGEEMWNKSEARSIRWALEIIANHAPESEIVLEEDEEEAVGAA